MSASFYDLLKYAHTGIASPSMTAYDKMRALAAFGGGKTQTLTGIPPLSFAATGKPLISWSMLGNWQQSGTPASDAPIMPTFCGVRTGNLFDDDNAEFGWKIPITCAGQTTPVYLGQVQTVRRIKKRVLTGKEAWLLWNGNYYSSVIDQKGAINTILCTHFIYSNERGISYNSQAVSGLKIASVAVPFVSSVNDLKAWLAAQYSAGTSVTVWYVLETPETAIVNEPLCKIGDYADELSSEDAGVSIPTVKGVNTLTVDTELQPSEMTITFK